MFIDRKRVDVRDVPLEHVVEVVYEEEFDVRRVEDGYARIVGFGVGADGPQRLLAREVPHDGDDQVSEMQVFNEFEFCIRAQESGEFSFYGRTRHQVPERGIGQAVSKPRFGVPDRKLFFVKRPVHV